MLTIDWIRHTSLQVTGAICYGRTDVDVSETFETEAAAVKSVLDTRTYVAAYSSPLRRARKLAEFAGMDAKPDPRVMERDFGEWEMRPWAEVFDSLRTSGGNTDYSEHLELLAPPGGETINRLIGRVKDFIEEVRKSHEGRIAVFCHGGVINSARFLNGELDIEHLFVHVPDYGSVTTIDYPTL